MYILGGIIFILMGANILRNIRTHSNEEKNINLIKEPHFTNFIGQGFITNTLNPAVFFLWIGIVGTSAPSFRHVGATIVFFLAIFCTTFGTDLLKIQLANALKHLLNPKNIYKLHIITGIILIMLGTGTIVKTIFH